MDNYLVFNQAEAIQYADVVQGNFLFTAVIPSVPTDGDLRKFGLYSANQQVGIYFQVEDETFRAVVWDESIGEGDYKDITFNTSWAGAPVDYQIIWEAGIAKFLIDGVTVAQIAFDDGGMSFATQPLSLYVRNDNADDLFIGVIEAKNVINYL